MELAASLGLFFPLLGFLTLVIFSKYLKKSAGWIGAGAIFLSFALFSSVFATYVYYDLTPVDIFLFKWIIVPKIDASFLLRIDPLSLLMTLIITGVGFLIHIYSLGYMEHEEDLPRYFACMNLFVFFMLLLVLAGHLLLLFVGWEGVGLASYLLIGFWYERKSAAAAATKAFVMNRIGDFAFLVALLIGFHLFETGTISLISQKAPAFVGPWLTAFTLLLFIGACGKSAQLPLHTWLADAMAGPTPVSALIHAATMVTAGVYLVVRMHSVYLLTPFSLQVVGTVGAFTSLFAAFCALGQSDLKRVLAYSTVSQLGLMFVACGAGAFYPAMFHLTSHAFVKALLFLSAGNVVHMLHGVTDMGKMGGMGKLLPKTRVLFLIGVLGLSGFPPLTAFFSKDLILEQEWLIGCKTLFAIALATSFLTAVYLTRAYCLTFGGTPSEDKHSVKEAPNVMLIPVMVLAVCTFFGGWLGYSPTSTAFLQGFLLEIGVDVAKREPGGFSLISIESVMAFFVCVLGIFLAAWIYRKPSQKGASSWQFLKEAFYIDTLYQIVIVTPLKVLSNGIAKVLEVKVFYGLIQQTAVGTNQIAKGFQKMQSGQIRSYVAWLVMGASMLIVYFVL